MRIRLRPKYTQQELAQIYRVPHDHTKWKDHIVRVQSTIALCKFFDVDSVADLSCGDATIANSVNAQYKYLGDFAPGYQFQGPVEETINQIPKVDLFILSETIEHLDDPDAVLKQIRDKCNYLVLTTPDGERGDSNPEHYWGWGVEDMRPMLAEAGFTPVVEQILKFPNLIYDYQMWGCV